MDYREDLEKRLETDASFKEAWDHDEPEREILKSIARLRHEKGLTQKDISAKSGISQGELSNIENGKTNPTLSTLQKLAKAMDSKLELKFTPLDTREPELL